MRGGRWRFADWRALLVTVALAGTAITSAHAAPPTRGEVFEEIWSTVRDNFHDRSFNGVDWNEARKRFGPSAAQAPSDEEFAAIINSMLATLHTSHTHYYNAAEPEYFQLIGIFWSFLEPKLKPFLPDGKPDYPGIGIGTHVLDEKLFVHHVFDGLPAREAGLRAGDEILGVDGAAFQPVRSFAGKVGQPVRMRIRRAAKAEPVEVVVTPKLFDPTKMFIEAMKASVEIIKRDGVKVGYVHVWCYAGEKYQLQLDEELNGRLREADALVIDLREGWGGASPRYLWPFIAPALTTSFIGEDGKRITHEEAWTKPVCLLVNEGSRSGKELLTYLFKKARRGPVVGTRTGGAVSLGRPFVLGDGSILYLAVSEYLVDGTRLEGVGVAPDVDVPFNPAYNGEDDPQKSRAVEVISRLARP